MKKAAIPYSEMTIGCGRGTDLGSLNTLYSGQLIPHRMAVTKIISQIAISTKGKTRLTCITKHQITWTSYLDLNQF